MAEVIDLERARRAAAQASDLEQDPFSLLTYEQLWIEERAEESWVCRALEIGPGRPCGLWGFGGCGKSYAALAIAIAAVTGRLLFGKFEVTRGRAVYLSHEMGRRVCVERARRLANGLLCAPSELKELEVGVYPRVKLNSRGARDAYLRKFDGCQLGIVDSFRRAIPGEDENDSKVCAHLDLLSEVSDLTGCSFLYLHHTGKEQPRTSNEGKSVDQRTLGRGSSAILDGSSSVWLMEGNGRLPRTLTQVRPHDDGDGTSSRIHLELSEVVLPEDLIGGFVAFDTRKPAVKFRVLDVKAAPLASDRIREEVLKSIREHPGQSKNDVETNVPGRASSIRDALAKLESDGSVRTEDGPHGSRLYFPAILK